MPDRSPRPLAELPRYRSCRLSARATGTVARAPSAGLDRPL